MGLEARCFCRHGLEAGEGRLQFEGDRVLFRGAFRLDVFVKDLKSVIATGDDLVLGWGRDKAFFALGAAVAPKWAHKILHPPSLLDKLGVKPGQRVALEGDFHAEFLGELSTRVQAGPRGATGGYDVVLWAFDTAASLEAAARLAPSLAPAGALWMIYPKGGKTVTETQVRAAGLAAGLVDNKTCSFSSELTALRWVAPKAARVTER